MLFLFSMSSVRHAEGGSILGNTTGSDVHLMGCFFGSQSLFDGHGCCQ